MQLFELRTGLGGPTSLGRAGPPAVPPARLDILIHKCLALALRADDVISLHRTLESLEGKLADGFDLGNLLGRPEHPLGDEDLAGLGLAAEPRGEIGDRADGAVIPPSFEADGADGGVALGDPDAEIQVEAALA